MNVAVLMEDGVAVVGCAIAAGCLLASDVGLSPRPRVTPGQCVPCMQQANVGTSTICLSLEPELRQITGNAAYDSGGSILIGSLLGFVAMTLIRKNRDLLVGSALPENRISRVVKMLETDPVVFSVHDVLPCQTYTASLRAICLQFFALYPGLLSHPFLRGTATLRGAEPQNCAGMQVKAIIIGADRGRFKAEINFDAEILAKRCLERTKFNTKALEGTLSEEEVLRYILQYSRSMVATLGDEVDRLEGLIRRELPEIRHVDLEIL
jgi:hypothetical protein